MLALTVCARFCVIDYLRLIILLNVIAPRPVMCSFMLKTPMLLCDCQRFIKESYLLTYLLASPLWKQARSN